MAPLETTEMSTPRITALEGGGPDDNAASSSPLAAARKEQQQKQHKIVVETLAWRDLSYYYKTKAKGGKGSDERAAVKQCTGLVRRGEMVAVMGPSGAGKSSLFDVLARRIGASGRLEGEMFVNGQVVDDKRFLRLSEYVQHEDVFVPTQTLLHALQYHANLRLGPNVSKEEKRARIEVLVQEAGLQDKLSTRIGGILAGGITVKGLSNGEKRRLSVVCAAIADPAILFLDEPTSGLDSFAALKVMEMMAKFCKEGRIIVCTIHQPRSQVYELFDRTLILSQGQTVFFGGTKEVLTWFDSALHRPLPLGTSIPDFVLDLVNVSFEADPSLLTSPSKRSSAAAAGGAGSKDKPAAAGQQQEKEEISGPVDVSAAAALFRRSTEFNALCTEIEAVVAGAKETPAAPLLLLGSNDHASISWGYRFRVVLGRNLRFYLANPGNVLVRLLISVIVGVFQGVVFFRAPDKQPLLVQSVALFICLFVTQALLLPFVSMTLFIEDRKFFVRESASRLYTTSHYFLANALLELVLTTTGAVIYGILTWFLCFYTETGPFAFDPQKFIVYLVFVIVGAHVGSMQGVTCVFCFGGVLPRLLFDKAQFIQFISPLKYSYTAMVESYFAGTPSWIYVEMMGITEPRGTLVNLGCLLVFFALYNVVAFWALDKLYRNKH